MLPAICNDSIDSIKIDTILASVYYRIIAIDYKPNKRIEIFRLISYAVVSIGLILFFELLSNTSEGIEVYATYEFYTNQ